MKSAQIDLEKETNAKKQFEKFSKFGIINNDGALF